MFKKGDRVIVNKQWDGWANQGYALNGWTGTIAGEGMFGEYIIKWDIYNRGNLIREDMIKKIKVKKEVKPYGIVNFMKGETKCLTGAEIV